MRTSDARFPWSEVVSWDWPVQQGMCDARLESVLSFTALGGSNPPPSAPEDTADQRERPRPRAGGVPLPGHSGADWSPIGRRRREQGSSARFGVAASGSRPRVLEPTSVDPYDERSRLSGVPDDGLMVGPGGVAEPTVTTSGISPDFSSSVAAVTVMASGSFRRGCWPRHVRWPRGEALRLRRRLRPGVLALRDRAGHGRGRPTDHRCPHHRADQAGSSLTW
jgi:hypothetical protein